MAEWQRWCISRGKRVNKPGNTPSSSLVEITSLVKFALRPYNYTFIRRAHSTAERRRRRPHAFAVKSGVCFFRLALMLLGALTASSQGSVAIIDLHSNHRSAFADDLQRVLEHRRCRHLSQQIKRHQTEPINAYGCFCKGVASMCR